MSAALKRRVPFAETTAESKEQQDYKRAYFEQQAVMAGERHAEQMAVLAKQRKLVDLKLELAANKLRDAAERQRLHLKILKSQLASNRRGQQLSEPSSESSSDSDADIIPPTP